MKAAIVYDLSPHILPVPKTPDASLVLSYQHELFGPAIKHDKRDIGGLDVRELVERAVGPNLTKRDTGVIAFHRNELAVIIEPDAPSILNRLADWRLRCHRLCNSRTGSVVVKSAQTQ